MIMDLKGSDLYRVVDIMLKTLYKTTVDWVERETRLICDLNTELTKSPPNIGFIFRGQKYLVPETVRYPISLHESLHARMEPIADVQWFTLMMEREQVKNLINSACSLATSVYQLHDLLPEGLTRVLKELFDFDGVRPAYVDELTPLTIEEFLFVHSKEIEIVKRRLTKNSLNIIK